MRTIITVTTLLILGAVILSAAPVMAKSKCSAPHLGYKNCADVCGDIIPILNDLGFKMSMGACVSANESANPAMGLCRNLQVGDPDRVKEVYGNFGQCVSKMGSITPKK